MSNFTKSIVYSGVVLAVGLIAIFAISSNMSPEGSRFTSLEPAAGTEAEATVTEGTAEGIVMMDEETAEDGTAESADDAYNAAAEAIEKATSAMTATSPAYSEPQGTAAPEEGTAAETAPAEGQTGTISEPATGEATEAPAESVH